MKKKKIIIPVIIAIILIPIVIISLKNFLQGKEDIIVDTAKYGHIDFSNTKNVSVSNYEKTNISPKIKETHKFKDYEISNMKIYTKENICYIEFNIKNISYSGGEPQMIDISFYDKKGNDFAGTYEFIDTDLTPGKSKKIVIKEITDFSNAYDYSMMTTF